MNDHDAPDPYPESTRLLAAREESQPIGEFLENGPYELGRWVPCQQWHQDGWECGQGEHFQPVRKSIETVLAEYFGIDMVNFGVVMTLLIMIGNLTPPVGMCLFAVESFAKVGLWTLAAECLPYLLAILAVTILCAFVPEIALWLPNTMMGVAN